MEDGYKEYVTVGDGSLIPVYMHRIVVQLALEEFNAMIGFSKQLGIGFNIIGRRYLEGLNTSLTLSQVLTRLNTSFTIVMIQRRKSIVHLMMRYGKTK